MGKWMDIRIWVNELTLKDMGKCMDIRISVNEVTLKDMGKSTRTKT